MTRPALLAKVRHLQRSCEYLRGMRGVGRGAFLADRTVQLAIQHALQEGIEACLDIGRMLLVEAGAGLPDTNRGVFLALTQHGLLPADRAEHWADMAGFRNVLVHGYDEVDLEIVFRALQERLEDLEAFGRAALQAGAAESGGPARLGDDGA